MSKMDRQGARTVADLERRYNFGKSFSEVLGIANDAQTHAYQAEEAVEKLERTVSDLSIFVLDEETGLNAKLEAKLDKDKLVSQFNLAANEITITSDNFSLDADGTIKAKKGIIGNWDISNSGIWKLNGTYYAHFQAPTTENDDVLMIALYDDSGTIDSVPFYLTAKGEVYSKGIFDSSNAERTRFTTIEAGLITIKGDYNPLPGDTEWQEMLVMQFYGWKGELCGIYVSGFLDNNLEFVPHDITVKRIG